ncbi:hypothetical protein Tco_0760402 [Tanacetum coccineum]
MGRDTILLENAVINFFPSVSARALPLGIWTCSLDQCLKSPGEDGETLAVPTHEVPLLTVTASRMIEMEDAASTRRGKSIASMGLDAGFILSTPAAQDPSTATKSVSDPEPLSYAKPAPEPSKNMHNLPRKQLPRSPPKRLLPRRLTSSSPWGVRMPPGYFPELRHLPNADFLSQYNINLARQVAMGSQLRLRFEQEVRLLKRSRSNIARRDKRIQVREEEIKKLDQEIKSLKTIETKVHGLRNQAKNLDTLLEAEVDMKKVAEAKNVELAKELESLRAQFAGLQVSNNQLSEQVSTLQTQVTGEERIKTAFEEFKKYEDDKVEQRCAEMDARLDKLSVDFDEELYPHMLTAIAGRRWVIGHGLRLAVMKYAESSEIRQAFADVVSAGLAKVSQSPPRLEGSEVSDSGSTGGVEGCPDRANSWRALLLEVTIGEKKITPLGDPSDLHRKLPPN